MLLQPCKCSSQLSRELRVLKLKSLELKWLKMSRGLKCPRTHVGTAISIGLLSQRQDMPVSAEKTPDVVLVPRKQV